MSNSELLRIKNRQKTPYKKQKTASSYQKYTFNGLMTVLGLIGVSCAACMRNANYIYYKIIKRRTLSEIFSNFARVICIVVRCRLSMATLRIACNEFEK